MRIYVAGALAEVESVREVQRAVVAAGHELTLDRTRGPDMELPEDDASRAAVPARLAADDLDAVMEAEAVLVVASDHDGRGMFVELGAALARARHGDLRPVVVAGTIRHLSVFYVHPSVVRVADVGEWLAGRA